MSSAEFRLMSAMELTWYMCYSGLLGIAYPPTLRAIHRELVDQLAAAEARIQEMEK